MKILYSLAFLTGIFFLPAESRAQQFQDFGNYAVHYNALTTNFIPAQVAQAYDIKRSSSRALLNITVLRKNMNTPGTPVRAEVAANGTNLIGQRREIDIREINESEGGIYYIGEFQVRNLETYSFTVEITPENETEVLLLKFNQQFYTE